MEAENGDLLVSHGLPSPPDPNAHGGRKILKLVFVTIIWGTLVDVFNGTVGLLIKYVKHLLLCLHYFWSPDIDRPPFDRFDFKAFCKYSFEGVIITLVVIIFSVKVDWLQTSNEWLKEWLGNDINQLEFQALMFGIFSLTYFMLVLISITTGRVIRLWLTPAVTRKESGILMITFCNAFFSITAITALVLRWMVSFRDNEFDQILTGAGTILLLISAALTLTWAVRFIQLNSVRGWKAILFFILSISIYTIIFTFGGFVTMAFLFIV